MLPVAASVLFAYVLLRCGAMYSQPAARWMEATSGQEHAWLADSGRAEYTSASDAEALDACKLLAQTEGIIPALESAHAVAEVIKRAPQMKKSEVVVVNVSGRGDKDIGILKEELGTLLTR